MGHTGHVRILTSLIIGTLALSVLTGCVRQNGLDPDTVADAFSDAPGVLGATSLCSQALPGYFTCTMWVVVGLSPDADDLENALTVVHTVVGPHLAFLVADSSFNGERGAYLGLTDEVPFQAEVGGSGATDAELAAGFVAALALPGVESVILSQPDDFAQVSLPDAETLAVADGARQLAAAMPEGDSVITGASLQLTTTAGVVAEDALALLTAIESSYPVLGSHASPTFLQVQVAPEVSLADVRTFAAAQPAFAAVGTVLVTNDDTDYSGLSEEDQALVIPVIEAAKELPEYVSAEPKSGRIEFAVKNASDIAPMDAALSSVASYSELGISYRIGASFLSRGPGLDLPTAVFENLMSHRFPEVNITHSEDLYSEYTVTVRSQHETDAKTLGRWLAESGLGDLHDAGILLAVHDYPIQYDVTFTAAPVIEFGAKDTLTAEQKGEFQEGWTAGLR